MDFENTGRANRKRRIFLDTETTGMCRSTDRIVEVCAIEVDDAFNEIDSFHAFIITRSEKSLGLSRAFMV